jgi:hypothetical protein
LAEYLASIGYEVVRTETTEPSESTIEAKLNRMNPAVPESGRELRFRFYPTSGGPAAIWLSPEIVAEPDRPRMDRLVREMVAHLERTVSTESHATAKITPAPASRIPWQGPESAPRSRRLTGRVEGP